MRISHLLAFGLALTTVANIASAQAPAPPPVVAPAHPAPAPAVTAPAAPSVTAPVPAATAPVAPAAPAPAAPAAPTPVAPATAPAPPPADGAQAVPPSAPPAVPPPPPAVPPALSAEPLPPPVPAPDLTAHRHDGFYLRMGLGGGFMASKVDAPIGNLAARGGGVAIEFALGGTIAEGLVIGGGIYSSSVGEVHWKGGALRPINGSDKYTGDQGSLGLLGVFVDYYPNPRDGFHVQGALGIGALTFDHQKSTLVPNEGWAGSGGGAMLGVGYEMWVGSQWSLGGVARLLLMSGSLRGEDTDRTFDAKGYAPALMFVATHH